MGIKCDTFRNWNCGDEEVEEDSRDGIESRK
jgi:hypothetical protein